MIPAGYRISNTTPTNASTNAVLAMFKMMNILNDSQITFLHALFQDSVATIVAIVFIFTPTFIANYGMITIALLLPAIRTASCCAPSTEKDSSKHNNYITTTTTAGIDFIPLQWLHYWMCVSILWILRIYAFKFWPSCLILVSLWLQHSYFLGATFAFNYTYQTILICIHRNEKVQQEKSKQNLLLLKENITSIDVAVAIADDDDHDWNKNDTGVDMDKDTPIEGQNIDCCCGE
jgi:hypothetical protein